MDAKLFGEPVSIKTINKSFGGVKLIWNKQKLGRDSKRAISGALERDRGTFGINRETRGKECRIYGLNDEDIDRDERLQIAGFLSG